MSVPNATVQKIEKESTRKTPLPEFRVGDTVKVWVRIREGDKTRLQAFEGVVIRRHRGENRASFTVRKISYGVGVERIFPDHSPNLDRIEVKARGKVRQARLYYLRDLTGKAARIKERGYEAEEQGTPGEIVDVEEAPVVEAKPVAEAKPAKADGKERDAERKAKKSAKKESRREGKAKRDKKAAAAPAE